MIRVMNEEDQVIVPGWVTDLESFSRWTETDAFPEQGNIGFLKGEVWIDLSREEVFSHVLVKTCYSSVLDGVVRVAKLGLYLSSGVFLRNDDADLSGKPDGTFVTNAALEEGRLRLVEGMLQGSPDMLLEVVSKSSVQKDKVDLGTRLPGSRASANTGSSMPGRIRPCSTSCATPHADLSRFARTTAG